MKLSDHNTEEQNMARVGYATGRGRLCAWRMGTGSSADPAEGQRTNAHSREGLVGGTQGHHAALLSLEVIHRQCQEQMVVTSEVFQVLFSSTERKP